MGALLALTSALCYGIVVPRFSAPLEPGGAGAMSVVVPVSAVTGVALSVLCGVLLLGDRPGALAWAGIAITVPALWWVSGGGSRRGRPPRPC